MSLLEQLTALAGQVFTFGNFDSHAVLLNRPGCQVGIMHSVSWGVNFQHHAASLPPGWTLARYVTHSQIAGPPAAAVLLQVTGGWQLNGQKRWIGNGTWADVTVVWARSSVDNQVRRGEGGCSLLLLCYSDDCFLALLPIRWH
jgi:hypothetical protein